jgi:hypothetical protein
MHNLEVLMTSLGRKSKQAPILKTTTTTTEWMWWCIPTLIRKIEVQDQPQAKWNNLSEK